MIEGSFEIPMSVLLSDSVQDAIIAKNMKKDPSYAPYCMRCPGLVRMRIVGHMNWDCKCGAKCDMRNTVLESVAEAFMEAMP